MIRRGTFLHVVSILGVAQAFEGSQAASATGAPHAAENAASSVEFYIAGWETPDGAPDLGVRNRIGIRVDRTWRVSR
jgi:hypothetical protein